MQPLKMQDETRCPGKPSDWDDEVHGVCEALSIQDLVGDNGVPYMVSAWLPTNEEVKAIEDGAPIYLWIAGREHPVVSLAVGSGSDVTY